MGTASSRDIAPTRRYRGMRMTLAEKLHPTRFPAMSGRMAAIIGYVLDEAWSEPDRLTRPDFSAPGARV
jgi:hypothetical protein